MSDETFAENVESLVTLKLKTDHKLSQESCLLGERGDMKNSIESNFICSNQTKSNKPKTKQNKTKQNKTKLN